MPEQTNPPDNPRGEVLVAVMNNARDWGIAQQHLWYRIPVARVPWRGPPEWLAFYHTGQFGSLSYSVRYYGRVREIRTVPRRELLPDEITNVNADVLYRQIRLESLQELPRPIPSARCRRIVFIPTTLGKLWQAAEINDLYDESPLEDLLWSELKKQKLAAERQLFCKLGKKWYALDFALFCREGKLNIETDGKTWHATPEQAAIDYPRDNEVQAEGWRVLRFSGDQVRDQASTYCLPKVATLVDQLGGPEDEALVPRRLYALEDATVQQFSFMEGEAEYSPDPPAPDTPA